MPAHHVKVLISSEAIEQKVGELAACISKDYAGRTPLLLVGVLKGSFIFLADLSRKISIPHAVDFIALSSYANATKSTGEVRLIMDLRQAIAGKHVLIVEDIVDTGHTPASPPSSPGCWTRTRGRGRRSPVLLAGTRGSGRSAPPRFWPTPARPRRSI